MQIADRHSVEFGSLAPVASLDGLGEAVIGQTLDGRITSWNAGAERLFGYSAHEMIAESVERLVPSHMVGEERELIAKLARGVGVDDYPTIRIEKNGRRIFVSLSAAPLRDATGAVVGASQIARAPLARAGAIDAAIDAARRTTLESRRLAAIVEGSDDAILSKTLEGIVTSWNAGATRIYGYSAREMIGTPLARLIPADLIEDERELIAKLARGGRIDHYETIRVAKDGRRIPVSLTVSPLRDAAGRIVGVSKIARDISERKRADEWRRRHLEELTAANARAADATKSLEESQRFTAIVLGAIPDLVSYWGADLECRFANHAYLDWFGKRPEEIVGLKLSEFLGDASFASNEPLYRAALSGQTQRVERQISTVDGKFRQCLKRCVPDFVDGKVVGFVLQISDITRLNDAEAELRAEIAGRERANQLLRESRDALQEAQRLGQIGSWQWAVDGDVLTWSEELYRMLGLELSREPLGFEDLGRRLLPESWLRLRGEIERTMTTGEPYSVELRFHHTDGIFGWIEAKGEAVRDERGKVLRLRGTRQDITKRKLADEQRERLIEKLSVANARATAAAKSLEDSERFTKMVLGGIPDLVVYWSADLKCRFANQAISDWYGKRPEDVVGAGLSEIFGEPSPDVERPIRAALAGQKQQFERSLETIDGRRRQVLVHYVPDFVDGEVVGIVVQAIDVTRLKETEAALRAEIARSERANQLLEESGQALREAQRVAQIGSWQWEIETDVLTWSEELYRMFGIDPKSTQPKLEALAEFFLPESWLKSRNQLARTLQTGESYAHELQIRQPGGQLCWLEARAEAVRDEHGQIVRLRGTTQDITKRKQADEQREALIEHLTAANEERAHFTRAASHDLREPLRMVEAFCRRLSKHYADRLDDRGREYLDLAVAGASRMIRMLDDLVEFDRLESGGKARWFLAKQPLDRALANLSERMNESGATIAAGPLPRIWGNPTRFERLMQNLIGNALKFARPGVSPKIDISARKDGEFWHFAVADNGIGVDPRHSTRIFEPFKRLHARDRYEGSGLGLAISRKIVEGFGGTIRVRPNEGGGSIFSFTVKVERVDDEEAGIDA